MAKHVKARTGDRRGRSGWTLAIVFKVLSLVPIVMFSAPSGVGQAREASSFPLSVATNARYLVDSSGSPFLVIGDAAWSMIANLTLEEADVYLTDRQAKGFTAILANLIEKRFAVNAPANVHGDSPFTIPGDFSTPNPAYFAAADRMVELAAEKGVAVFLDVMYLGESGGPEGFWEELTSDRNTGEICFEYGRFLGELLHDNPNVVFVIGGDYTPEAGSEGVVRLRRIIEGVKAAGADQPWTAHWSDHGAPLATDVGALADLIDVQSVYPPSSAVYRECSRGFAGQPPMPTVLIEAGYEGERWKPGDTASVRSYEWSGLLGGCTAGVFYGHRDIWEFATDTWNSGFGFDGGPWEAALHAPGAIAMEHMGRLLRSLPWHGLVPGRHSDANWLGRIRGSVARLSLEPGRKISPKALVASGLANSDDRSQVIAAASEDGKFMLAYRPDAHSGGFTVDMTAMSGPVTARWWDPTSGAFIDIASGLPNIGVRSFDPPDTNTGGARDWVLVLTA